MKTKPTKANAESNGKVPVNVYSTVDMWLLKWELNEYGKNESKTNKYWERNLAIIHKYNTT